MIAVTVVSVTVVKMIDGWQGVLVALEFAELCIIESPDR